MSAASSCPDLPLEERDLLGPTLDAAGLALVQLVTPLTAPERLARLCAASGGFVYAVTRTGTTGGASALPADTARYLDRVRAHSPVPVCAGFGIRSAAQVAALAGHADGAIVGSALLDALDRGGRARTVRGRPAAPLCRLGGAPWLTPRAVLFGHPVHHSRSPELFEALAAAGGPVIDFALQDVPLGQLPAALDRLRAGEWDCAGVTIPYKTDVSAACEALHPSARAAGAVNAILRRPDGSLLGANTDGEGLRTRDPCVSAPPRPSALHGGESSVPVVRPAVWGPRCDSPGRGSRW